MTHSWRWAFLLSLTSFLSPELAPGQIDPVKRDLFQFGYNAAFEGHAPLSAYAFYYRNQPGFLQTNWTLRLALAPTYLDSELGFRNALGENTDVGIGVAGGGYADSYNEIRQGKFLPEESFDGFSGELNTSVYHLFNPGQRIPLNGLVRGMVHYTAYGRQDDTVSNFQLPRNQGSFKARTGLRWGGREPTLFPALAMELSVWYQGEFRAEPGVYGFGDRRVEPHTHLFWGEAFLAYTLPELHHNFSLGVTAGTSINADRFSSYRLGAFLPLSAEFPLALLPGYYYQEISADKFVLVNANYIVPLDRRQRWNVNVTAATAVVDYLPGLEQPGHWHSGVGGGVFYTSPSWRVMMSYGYGVDAIRSSGRGAQSVGLLLQLDLEHAQEAFFGPEPPSRWQGLQRLMGVFGS